jgi:hypothetical protein
LRLTEVLRVLQVFQAILTQSGRRGVALPAAVKTLKNTDGRAELLREGAMMALFEHANIVVLIGVVTTPRDMCVALPLACYNPPFIAAVFQCTRLYG